MQYNMTYQKQSKLRKIQSLLFHRLSEMILELEKRFTQNTVQEEKIGSTNFCTKFQRILYNMLQKIGKHLFLKTSDT